MVRGVAAAWLQAEAAALMQVEGVQMEGLSTVAGSMAGLPLAMTPPPQQHQHQQG